MRRLPTIRDGSRRRVGVRRAALAPAVARAQAWLPFEREAAVSVTYQQLDFGGHFDTDGSKLEDDIPSRAHLAIAEIRIRADQ